MTLPLSYRFGGGTPTATFAAGGAPSPVAGVKTEEYNGTGWSAGGDMGTSRYEGGSAGTLTAGLIYGGYFSPPASVKGETEEYNGTAWSEQTNLSTSGYSQGGFGTQTAAVYTNRYVPSLTADTEEYNGSSWSEGNNSSTNRADIGTAGTLTAGMIFGGQVPPATFPGTTELYDGTNWTAGPAMNTARGQLGGSGTQTAAIAFGGREPAVSAKTESFDGTSWSETSDLATARRQLSSNRSNTGNSAALAFGGNPVPATGTLTEEYNNSASVITAAAFSSGTNFPTSSSAVAGAGPRDAALGIGGYPEGSPPTGKSFEYNGVAWSAEATLNPNTGTAGVNSAAGTQTACINSQSNPGPPYPYDAAGEYDGSSWSNAEDRPTANYSDASAGTLTAALFFGGAASPTSLSNATISYDGTNWTVEESMSTTRSIACGSGTSTAALAGGGLNQPSPAVLTSNSEEYGGESWTAGGAMLEQLREHRAGGTLTDTLEFGGRIQGAPPSTFRLNSSTYDGTTWSSGPNLATARGLSGSGNGPVGAIWGAAGYYPGSSPNRTNTTEHFNVETTAINVKTLTQS